MTAWAARPARPNLPAALVAAVADFLDRSKQSEVLDVINRASAECMALPAEKLLKLLQFAEKVD